jgi:hypothetical protein
MTVYFQHFSGEIRSIQLTPKGEWIGGSKTEVVVSDAKNATPISAVSYSLNGTSLVSSLMVLIPSAGADQIFHSGISSIFLKTVL